MREPNLSKAMRRSSRRSRRRMKAQVDGHAVRSDGKRKKPHRVNRSHGRALLVRAVEVGPSRPLVLKSGQEALADGVQRAARALGVAHGAVRMPAASSAATSSKLSRAREPTATTTASQEISRSSSPDFTRTPPSVRPAKAVEARISTPSLASLPKTQVARAEPKSAPARSAISSTVTFLPATASASATSRPPDRRRSRRRARPRPARPRARRAQHDVLAGKAECDGGSTVGDDHAVEVLAGDGLGRERGVPGAPRRRSAWPARRWLGGDLHLVLAGPCRRSRIARPGRRPPQTPRPRGHVPRGSRRS